MAKPSSFIKLNRNILEWEWYSDHNVKDVFLHLLLTANYDVSAFRGIEIQRGQCVITVAELEKTLKLSSQQIRTALSKLKLTNEITIKSYSKFQVITVVSYDKYQGASTNKITNKQQTNNNQITNNQQHKKNIRNKEYNNTHTYAYARGKYENVFLTDNEVAELVANWGEERFNESIEELSAYIYDKPDFKSEHHIVPLTTWVQDRLNERANKKARVQARDAEKNSKVEKAKAAGFDFDFEDIYERP